MISAHCHHQTASVVCARLSNDVLKCQRHRLDIIDVTRVLLFLLTCMFVNLRESTHYSWLLCCSLCMCYSIVTFKCSETAFFSFQKLFKHHRLGFFFFTPFPPFSLSLLIFIFAFYRVLFINSLDISVRSEDAFLFCEHIVWLKFYRPQGKIIVAS